MTTETHEGGCLCGSIRYRATGLPAFAVICTCTQCMRQTKSPLPTYASYPLGHVALVSGSPKSYRASDHASREFCADCGSFLFWRRDGGSRVGIAFGSFDDPSGQPKPSVHIWARHRVEWLGDLPIEKVVAEDS
jgi:hypothetical protein